MKKTLIHMALFFVIFIGLSNACYGGNLVQNGDFKKIGQDGRPSGWNLNLARDTLADFSYDETRKTSDGQAFKMTLRDAGGQVTLMPEQNTIRSPIPGKTYELVLQVMAENLDYNRFMGGSAIRMDFRPTRVRPTPIINLMDEFENNTGWKELRMAVVAPEDAERFVLDIILTKGTLWIDSVTLRQIN